MSRRMRRAVDLGDEYSLNELKSVLPVGWRLRRHGHNWGASHRDSGRVYENSLVQTVITKVWLDSRKIAGGGRVSPLHSLRD